MDAVLPIIQGYDINNRLYAVRSHPDGRILRTDTKVLEALVLGNIANYAIALNDVNNLGVYVGQPPAMEYDFTPIDMIFAQKQTVVNNVITYGSPDLTQDTRIDLQLGQGVNVASIAGVIAAAPLLAALTQTFVRGAAVAGTLSVTEMTCDVVNLQSGAMVGRALIFLTGALAGSAAVITGWDGAAQKFTFSAMPVAPAIGDTFVVS